MRIIMLEAGDTASKKRAKRIITPTEKDLKRKLIKMLLNADGSYGTAHHAKYAKYLNDYFDIEIVSKKADPEGKVTAYIDPDNATIAIGWGFLSDPTKQYQLNVIIRHELAHDLLKHNLRMLAKVGKKHNDIINHSRSLHDLINYIADFEISNRKYTPEDKRIILGMWLAGKLISGLVTENHREAWIKLSLEDMYDRLTEEIEELNRLMLAANSENDADAAAAKYAISKKLSQNWGKQDGLTMVGLQALKYVDLKSPSIIWKDNIENFFARSKFFKQNLDAYYRELIKNWYNKWKDLSETEIKDLQKAISESKPIEGIALDDETILETPEDKFLAQQVLKYLLGNAIPTPTTLAKPDPTVLPPDELSADYIKKYNEIIKKYGKLGEYTAEDISKILDSLGTAIKGDTH